MQSCSHLSFVPLHVAHVSTTVIFSSPSCLLSLAISAAMMPSTIIEITNIIIFSSKFYYVSSHRFLLRRVWHLAIPTPPAMGYSPTEYAEFTEPPTEMSSHGFHRFTQILRVRCSPTEFTEYTEFGSVGMAGMPYPPTSVRIRVICGRLFSARSFCEFRAFCGNLFPPTDFTDLHRYLGCAVIPQNSQNSQNLAA